MVDKKMYPLESMAKIMESAYLECSDIAMDYLTENGVEGLDEQGDFTDDESKSLAIIATVMWQAIFAALRVEDFKPNKDGRNLDALVRQIYLAHFG